MASKEVAVLHVEDNVIDQINVKRVFRKNNISAPLFQVTNGEEALEFLADFDPVGDEPTNLFLLVDINMPKMNGLELLAAIRNHSTWKHLPVVIMTTSDNPADKNLAYQLNASGYVIKPVNFQQYSEAVTTLSQYWKLIAA